jgi:hypothetical protein
LAALNQAAAVLGLAEQQEHADALAQWVAQWRDLNLTSNLNLNANLTS